MKKSLVLSCALAGVIVPGAVGQILVGQTDTFAADKAGWAVGGTSPVQPVWVANGGPLGAGDGFLQIASSGSGGAGGRLVVFNRVQWAGNFTANSIQALSLDLNNLGSTALNMRVGFEDSTGSTLFVSTVSYALPASSGWVHAELPITSSALTRVSGTKTYAETLSSVIELRLLSAAGGPAWVGDVVVATVGIDNFKAVVPEPAGTAGVFAAMAALSGIALKTAGARRNRRAVGAERRA